MFNPSYRIHGTAVLLLLLNKASRGTTPNLKNHSTQHVHPVLFRFFRCVLSCFLLLLLESSLLRVFAELLQINKDFDTFLLNHHTSLFDWSRPSIA